MKEIERLFRLVGPLLLSAAAALALQPEKALTQYSRTTWTQVQGLPSDTVRRIAQTLDGYLWLATDEGLARFDGYEFTVFSRATGSLPSDSVTALVSSPDGSLWIGTPDGLVHYANGLFQTLTTKDGLPDNNIVALYADHQGTAWIASGVSLCTLEKNGQGKDTLRVIPREKLATLDVPRAFFEDSQGVLWISGAGGVIRRDGTAFSKVLGPQEMRGLIANSVLLDREGTLWVGGDKGMLAYSAKRGLTRFDAPDRLPNSLVRALLLDRDGVLWAGTNGGLARLEQGRFAIPSLSGAQDRSSVRSLFEDKEGNLWMGTGAGLIRFRDDRFTSFGAEEGWPDDEPTAVHEDSHGILWVGYRESGLLGFSQTGPRPTRLHAYTTRDGLVSNEVFAIREARNGDLLIATRNGLSRLHAGQFQNFELHDPLQRGQVFDVIEDPQGRLIAAAPTGAVVLGRPEPAPLIPGGPLLNDNIVALQQTPAGELWAGTYGKGLWYLAPGKEARLYTTSDGMSSNRIRALLGDDDGILWIGTFGGGLLRFDGKSFATFTARQGLPSDNISHLSFDALGFLWISTTRGIARVAKADLAAFAAGRLKSLPVSAYGLEDGLRSLQSGTGVPVAGGGTRTRDGRIWFTTGNSVAVTDPRTPDPQGLLFPARLIEVSAAGQFLDLAQRAELPPNAGSLQIRFSGLHLRAPERLRYQYRLEGLAGSWSAPSARRMVTYNGLPHGDYRFLVRALLPGQPTTESSFSFVVLPHFYETAWFLWLCIAALSASIYGAYRWRLRQIHARFALVIAERTRLAREIHDTLAQGFFGISSQLDSLSVKLDDPDAVREELHLARRMARHSLAEARRSVMDLRTSALEDQDLAAALASSARQWTEGNPVALHLNVPASAQRLLPEVEQNILRIAQEAVTNALRHARPRSISIDLSLEAKRLQLRVRDDGIGFDATRSLSDTTGHFGLIGMQERALRVGGMFNVASLPGHGTTVEVTVPV